MRQRTRKRQMSEINVVPYIDVMLVLLVIFMITAPLLSQGVKVDLPQTPAKPLPQLDDEPVIISIDGAGKFYLNLGDDPDQAVTPEYLVTRVGAIRKYKPATPVYVKGDRAVDYGRVVELMAVLQSAGVEGVGLVTEPLSKK
jgi:biopolymer transport protein TolR